MNKTTLHPHRTVSAMTVDVEEYFQVAAFSDIVKPTDWPAYPARAELQVKKILQLFERHQIRGTFFILETVAKQFPALVHEIASFGHEVASHGSMHQKADQQTPGVFRKDIVDSKHRLEDLIGKPVIGYRAPSFSINPGNAWAFDAIKEAGFLYSSSTYPIEHDHYGSTLWPRNPFYPVSGLLEVPQATLRLANKSFPVGGGGYFRLMPYALSKWAISQAMRRNDFPYVFYFHPWEIDPEQPRIAGASARSVFRHYVNQRHMLKKIGHLCSLTQWSTMADVFGFEDKVELARERVA